MELKQEIDTAIQTGLRANGISFPLDNNGRIAIHEMRMDIKAKAGMLYLIPENKIPRGELPFIVIKAMNTYGVFYIDGQAVIIEVSTMAINGEIIDYYNK